MLTMVQSESLQNNLQSVLNKEFLRFDEATFNPQTNTNIYILHMIIYSYDM
jgi:hypothetical protein